MMLNFSSAEWKMSNLFAVGLGEYLVELHSSFGQTGVMLHEIGIEHDICFENIFLLFVINHVHTSKPTRRIFTSNLCNVEPFFPVY